MFLKYVSKYLPRPFLICGEESDLGVCGICNSRLYGHFECNNIFNAQAFCLDPETEEKNKNCIGGPFILCGSCDVENYYYDCDDLSVCRKILTKNEKEKFNLNTELRFVICYPLLITYYIGASDYDKYYKYERNNFFREIKEITGDQYKVKPTISLNNIKDQLNECWTDRYALIIGECTNCGQEQICTIIDDNRIT